MADTPALDTGVSDFMIGGWFKIATGTAIQTLFEKYQGTGYCGSNNANIGWEVIYRADQATKTMAFRPTDGTASGTIFFALTNQKIADGEWHHLCFAWDKSVGMKIYCDSFLITNTAFTNVSNNLDNTGAFRIGVRQDVSASSLYQGNISNIFFYNPQHEVPNQVLP